jgi:transcriptional regulator with XRE-family HTH domain
MTPQNLTWDEAIYPRSAVNRKTVEAYVEALSIGAQFPPVKVQQVVNYTPGGDLLAIVLIIIDGVHRWFAFTEAGRSHIPVIHYQDRVLDYEAVKTELLLESAQNNTTHGDRLTIADKKRIARDIATSDPDHTYTDTALAEKLGVSRQAVNTWITDIRARQKTSRTGTIIRLHRLGWTQENISTRVGLSRNRVSEIVGNAIYGNIDTLLEQGRDMAYIASHYQMDMALAWALRLTGLHDRDKFKALDWGLRTWDQWQFNDCDDRFGSDWPGRIPAQLVAHTLYYFTRPGDRVLDPMAGGGVVPDVCLLFERKCRAFDQNPHKDRPEIEPHHWDPDTGDWPLTDKPDLIFFDPPYYTKLDKAYKAAAAPKAPSVSSLPREDYLRFFARFFTLAHEHTRPGTTLAFLNADWRNFESTPAAQETPDQAVTLFDYHDLLSQTGWQTTHRIECPLSTQRLTSTQVQRMQAKRILGTIGRTLLIARRT